MGGVCVAVHSEKFRRHIRSSIQHPLSSTAKEFRLRHHFERSFPDAPPPRAPPRLAQQNSRTPCPIDFKILQAFIQPSPKLNGERNFASGTILSEVFQTPRPLAHPRDLRSKTRAPLAFTPPPPELNGERISPQAPLLSRVPDAPPPRAPPRLAQQNSRTPCPIDFKFYRPSFHHPQCRTEKEFRLRHHFERSFPDAPPNSRTPETCAAKPAHPLHHFEPSFPDAPPLAHPRDSRSKTRAPLVRLTSNFTGHHSTTPNAERRKNFASGTILSGVFPTPRPLAHPRDLRSKTRAPLVRLTSNFTCHHSTTPELNGKRISPQAPF
ncbi:hypothetical protein niasHT_034708 [Heterodera trifolii]|uniref:Uncharacterized protein n=1 Tax=Heterodera trifolii TaxID=157864 RepID=A0ABD2HST8_9BILA